MKNGIKKTKQIKENILRMINENSFCETQIKEDQDLFIDFDFDSLAYSSLIIDVEEFFSIEILKNDIEKGLRTPSDFISIVKEKLK